MEKYILVEWPESQKYMDKPGCYLFQPNEVDEYGRIGPSYFVPEHIYNKDVNEDLMISLAEQV